MIETIFIITWDDLREFANNNNGFYDSENNGQKTVQNTFVENPRFEFFYPESNLTFENDIAMSKVLENHKEQIQKFYKSSDEQKEQKKIVTKDCIKSKIIFDSAVCTIYIPGNIIVGMIFDNGDNPIDYTDLIEENIDLYVNSKREEFDSYNAIDLEIMAISIYLDLRMYGLELLETCKMHFNEDALKNKIQDQYENRVIKVFLYGIDSAGKSSLMRFLRTGKYDHNYFPPTKRFIVHKLKLPNKVKIIGWETPGQKSYRRTWMRGIKDCDLIVFMLDAADPGRTAEAKRAFWTIANRIEVKDVPLLFLVHKIDLVQNRRDLANIENFFGLSNLDDRKWSIKFTSLVTKEGIKDAIDWVSETLNENIMSELAKELQLNGSSMQKQ